MPPPSLLIKFKNQLYIGNRTLSYRSLKTGMISSLAFTKTGRIDSKKKSINLEIASLSIPNTGEFTSNKSAGNIINVKIPANFFTNPPIPLKVLDNPAIPASFAPLAPPAIAVPALPGSSLNLESKFLRPSILDNFIFSFSSFI